MRLIDVDEVKEDFSEILEHDYEDDYARGFQAALVAVLGRKAITLPPNDPLILEQLRGMDGEPVWVIFYAPYGETVGMWALVSVDEYTREVFLTNRLGGRSMYEEAFVDIKAIYRRKPEEGISVGS